MTSIMTLLVTLLLSMNAHVGSSEEVVEDTNFTQHYNSLAKNSSKYYDDSSKLECFFSIDTGAPSCNVPEEQNKKALGPMWSNLLGIGSAKTATTALFKMLRHHRDISIGEATRGGR
jgi:hypothetical protein